MAPSILGNANANLAIPVNNAFLPPPITNFIILKLKTMDSLTFLKKLENKRVLALPLNNELVRVVTHKDIDDSDIDIAAKAIREIFV